VSAPGRNPFGHVDLRVCSIDRALPFYEQLMPALGFTRRFHGPEWKVWAAELDPPAAAYLGIVERPDHRPNANRIAFWTAAPEEVDRVAAVASAAGALETSGPRPMPYGPGYYAAYFADPSGNPFEVYHRPPA
jgi:catechol 2,3-dioxygenase-like lactoylglutathione lyase family enzyme